MPPEVSVLFVCSGNICRSPTAEGVFRALLAERGLGGRVGVDSAGVGDWHVGEPPDPRSVAAARAWGVDLSGQRARQVRPEDCARFDLLVAMDEDHRRALARLCAGAPGARARVVSLLDFAPEAGEREVPDPYYGGEGGFARVLDLILAGARGLLAEVEGRLGGA